MVGATLLAALARAFSPWESGRGDVADGGMRPSGEGAEAGGDGGEAGAAEQGDGEVAAGREGLGSRPRADGGAILVEGDVADVVEAVLDLPVAALEAQEGGGIGTLGRQARDEERH